MPLRAAARWAGQPVAPDCLNRVLNMECVPVSPTHDCLPCTCTYRIDMCSVKLYLPHISASQAIYRVASAADRGFRVKMIRSCQS